MTADPFLRYRDQFPILKSKRYLVSHSLGAMPLGAREALLELKKQGKARFLGVTTHSGQVDVLDAVVNDPDKVFDMAWVPPPGFSRTALVRSLNLLRERRRTDCSTCHR